ncbi:MAG TPA: cupin domain-containing protein [Gaiellaceae bacterium]|nr:cupin domain-containing protein [Gaiellaceae bacterium]
MAVPEASLEQTDAGLAPGSDGWFVVNAREAQWFDRGPRGLICRFDGDGELEFSQLGFHLFVLGPGEPMSMYHWEADEEAFLVLSGEALLLVEGEERPLRAWDFMHCPPRADHTIVGAGEGKSVIIAVGARVDSTGPNWGGYPVHDVAVRRNASAQRDTTDPEEAYARFPARRPARYEESWLP